MKVVRNAIRLIVVAILLGGCASTRVADIQQPDGKYVPAIYSAATSSSASRDRAKMLSDIASKVDLTKGEQLYLVDVLDSVRGFSSDVTAVLVALLQNPSIAEEAEDKVSELVPKLDLFMHDVERLVTILSK